MMRGFNFAAWTLISLISLSLLQINVSAHTPNTITSILSDEGPRPENITQSTDFFEGDEVWFLMKDSEENVSMRVIIDIDGDGVFNQSNDVFSSWMNYSCELNENGTETLDENCTVDFKYTFSENNSAGTYFYQVERRVEENYTNSWLNTIFVGIDIHEEDNVPNVGDCFGAGCNDDSEGLTVDSDDGLELDLIKILILVSAIGVIGMSLSIIRESREDEDLEKKYGEE